MKTLFIVLVLISLRPSQELLADDEKTHFYVQLVHGSNADAPPAPQLKPVGAKVAAALSPVFVWAHYWEINRQELDLAKGQSSKLRLTKDHQVQIELTADGKRIVTAYSNDAQVARSSRPVGEAMTVIGGDKGNSTAWFIVVRRDKPLD